LRGQFQEDNHRHELRLEDTRKQWQEDAHHELKLKLDHMRLQVEEVKKAAKGEMASNAQQFQRQIDAVNHRAQQAENELANTLALLQDAMKRDTSHSEEKKRSDIRSHEMEQHLAIAKSEAHRQQLDKTKAEDAFRDAEVEMHSLRHRLDQMETQVQEQQLLNEKHAGDIKRQENASNTQLEESEAERKLLKSKYVAAGEKLEQIMAMEGKREAERQKLADALRDADHAMDALRSQNKEMRKSGEEREEDLTELERLVKKQDMKLDKYRDKLDRTQRELEEVSRKGDADATSLEKLRQERRSMMDQLDDSNKALGKVSGEHHVLKGDHVAMMDRNLEGQVDRLDTILKRTIQDKDNQILDMATEMQRMVMEHTDTQAKFKVDVQNKIMTLATEYESNYVPKTEHDKVAEAKKKFEARLSVAEAELRGAQTSLEQLHEQLLGARETLQQEQTQRTRLVKESEVHHAELELERKARANATQEHDQLSNKMQSHTAELLQERDRVLTLVSQLEEARQAHHQVAQANGQLSAQRERDVRTIEIAQDDAKRLDSELDDERALVRQERTRTEQEMERRKQAEEACGELQKRLRALEDEALRNQEDLNSEIVRYRHDLQRSHESQQAAEMAANNAQSTMPPLQMQCTNMQMELETMAARLKQSDNALAEAKDRCVSLVQRLEEAQREADRVKWEATQKDVSSQRNDKECDRLKLELEGANRRIGELTADRTKLTTEVHKVQDQLDEALRQTQRIDQELMGTMSEAKQLRFAARDKNVTEAKVSELMGELRVISVERDVLATEVSTRETKSSIGIRELRAEHASVVKELAQSNERLRNSDEALAAVRQEAGEYRLCMEGELSQREIRLSEVENLLQASERELKRTMDEGDAVRQSMHVLHEGGSLLESRLAELDAEKMGIPVHVHREFQALKLQLEACERAFGEERAARERCEVVLEETKKSANEYHEELEKERTQAKLVLDQSNERYASLQLEMKRTVEHIEGEHTRSIDQMETNHRASMEGIEAEKRDSVRFAEEDKMLTIEQMRRERELAMERKEQDMKEHERILKEQSEHANAMTVAQMEQRLTEEQDEHRRDLRVAQEQVSAYKSLMESAHKDTVKVLRSELESLRVRCRDQLYEEAKSYEKDIGQINAAMGLFHRQVEFSKRSMEVFRQTIISIIEVLSTDIPLANNCKEALTSVDPASVTTGLNMMRGALQSVLLAAGAKKQLDMVRHGGGGHAPSAQDQQFRASVLFQDGVQGLSKHPLDTESGIANLAGNHNSNNKFDDAFRGSLGVASSYLNAVQPTSASGFSLLPLPTAPPSAAFLSSSKPSGDGAFDRSEWDHSRRVNMLDRSVSRPRSPLSKASPLSKRLQSSEQLLASLKNTATQMSETENKIENLKASRSPDRYAPSRSMSQAPPSFGGASGTPVTVGSAAAAWSDSDLEHRLQQLEQRLQKRRKGRSISPTSRPNAGGKSFDEMDANGDGVISRQEWGRVQGEGR